MRKKKNKKTVTDTGYKKVDRKEKKKKEKQEEKRRQKKLSVQQSIAYKEMGRDGICRVQGKTYSKCIRFYDINYQLAQNEDKNAIFENWCDFLNYFDASIHFQLSFINHKSSMKEFEQVIRIRPQEDLSILIKGSQPISGFFIFLNFLCMFFPVLFFVLCI